MRAEQTAQLLAARVGRGTEPEEITGIDPLDSVSTFAERVSGWTEDTMVVGHLPFMGKLVSLLTCGDDEADVVTFHAGSLACLTRLDEGGWSVAWMIDPRILTDEQDTGK